LTTASELRRHLGAGAKITMLSSTEQFTFLPSLPWLAMGYKRPESLVFDIRNPLAKKGIEFIRGEASSVDPARQVVIAQGKELPYDYLVMATGASLDFEAVPGLGPSAHTTSILTLEHALSARDKLGRVLGNEEGHIVVGSAQGASCLGPAYQFLLMIDQELRRRQKRHRFHLQFITPEPFLGHFGIGGMGKARRLFEEGPVGPFPQDRSGTLPHVEVAAWLIRSTGRQQPMVSVAQHRPVQRWLHARTGIQARVQAGCLTAGCSADAVCPAARIAAHARTLLVSCKAIATPERPG
jgi:hypothetical protein